MERDTDCPVLCSSFSPIYVLRNTVQADEPGNTEPAAKGSQAQVLCGPSRMLVFNLEDANW